MNEHQKEQVKQLTEKLVKDGGKRIDQIDEHGNFKKGTPSGLPHKTAMRIARRAVTKYYSYTPGKLGKSEMAGLQPRRVRRELARQNGTKFEPVLN